MKRTLLLSLFVLASLGAAGFAPAVQAQDAIQTANIRPHPLAPAEIDRIIRTLAAKETQFRNALNQYTFKRDAVVQTVGMGGQISGEFRRTSNFIFNPDGTRYERVLFAPMATLTEIQITPEDLEDLGGVQPFALEASKIDRYNFNYLGEERIDELDLYVFDVAPKTIPKKVSERFFQGRIWVDTHDLQIVKARGKGVPEGDQRFPTFETYREQIDNKYWFPTYTYADDQLVFKTGQVVRVRMRVRYTDYKLPRTQVEIVEDDNVEDAAKDATPQNAQPSRTPAQRKP